MGIRSLKQASPHAGALRDRAAIAGMDAIHSIAMVPTSRADADRADLDEPLWVALSPLRSGVERRFDGKPRGMLSAVCPRRGRRRDAGEARHVTPGPTDASELLGSGHPSLRFRIATSSVNDLRRASSLVSTSGYLKVTHSSLCFCVKRAWAGASAAIRRAISSLI
jgi:hypothetical protein